jgi:hypothetical protein
MKMFFAYAVVLVIACNSNKNSDGANLKKDSSQFITAEYSDRRIDSSGFLSDYHDMISFDTTLINDSASKVHIKHHITQANYLLPEKYVFDDTSNRKLIYYTESVITVKDSIIRINAMSVSHLINDEDRQLKEYGVLLLSADQIKLDDDVLELSYSYSIPFTDLGKLIIVRIKLRNMNVTIES